MAKAEAEVVEDFDETPEVVYMPKESIKDKIIKHKNKIIGVGATVVGGFILAKLANHSGRITRLEDLVEMDSEDDYTEGDGDTTDDDAIE